MSDEFDRWNRLKKTIEARFERTDPYPHEGEVWMCSLGRNIGYEQNGSGDGFGRPAVVIKKFNNKMYWVVPLTTKQKPLDFYHNFVDPLGQPAGAVLAQLRLLSEKRFDRKMYSIDSVELEEIKTKVGMFLR